MGPYHALIIFLFYFYFFFAAVIMACIHLSSFSSLHRVHNNRTSSHIISHVTWYENILPVVSFGTHPEMFISARKYLSKELFHTHLSPEKRSSSVVQNKNIMAFLFHHHTACQMKWFIWEQSSCELLFFKLLHIYCILLKEKRFSFNIFKNKKNTKLLWFEYTKVAKH